MFQNSPQPTGANFSPGGLCFELDSFHQNLAWLSTTQLDPVWLRLLSATWATQCNSGYSVQLGMRKHLFSQTCLTHGTAYWTSDWKIGWNRICGYWYWILVLDTGMGCPRRIVLWSTGTGCGRFSISIWLSHYPIQANNHLKSPQIWNRNLETIKSIVYHLKPLRLLLGPPCIKIRLCYVCN